MSELIKKQAIIYSLQENKIHYRAQVAANSGKKMNQRLGMLSHLKIETIHYKFKLFPPGFAGYHHHPFLTLTFAA